MGAMFPSPNGRFINIGLHDYVEVSENMVAMAFNTNHGLWFGWFGAPPWLTRWAPLQIAFSWDIGGWILCFMVDITMVDGGYTPTYNWGAPSCRKPRVLFNPFTSRPHLTRASHWLRSPRATQRSATAGTSARGNEGGAAQGCQAHCREGNLSLGEQWCTMGSIYICKIINKYIYIVLNKC